MVILAKPNFNISAGRLPGGVHYSWVIVAILALVQIVGSSVSMSAGVMVPPLKDPEGAFGWNIGTIGVAIAVFYLVGALFAPVSGWLGDRYGPRRILTICGVLYGGSMLLLGLLTELWQFFLVFSVMLAVTQSMAMVPLMNAVGGWFKRRLGLGTGILWAAGGVGAAALAPLVGYLLDNIGWQGTFWSIGIVGGGILLVLSVFFRNRPSDMGLKPYGALPDDPPEIPRSKAVDQLRLKVFSQHIRRTRAFWNLPIIHGLGCAGHGIILIYSIPIAVEQGISLTAASFILALISIFSITGRFITPIVAERFGGKPIMATALFIQGITVLVLFWAHDAWTFYLFGALFGLGFGGEMSAYLVVNRQYYGTGPLSTFYGFEMMGAQSGHAVATLLGGLAIYATGSFIPALGLSMAFSFVGVLVILNLESTARILVPNWEESLPAEARVAPVQARAEAVRAPLLGPVSGDG
ncbi:MAG: MFS transporter [Chloroflexota bacterium]